MFGTFCTQRSATRLHTSVRMEKQRSGERRKALVSLHAASRDRFGAHRKSCNRNNKVIHIDDNHNNTMAESSCVAMQTAPHSQKAGFTETDLVSNNLKGCRMGGSVVLRCSSLESSDRSSSNIDDAKSLRCQPNCSKRKKKKRNHLIWEGNETLLCPAVKRCRWSVVSNSDQSENDNNNITNISIIRENEQEEMQRRTNVSKKKNKCRQRVRFQLDSVGNVVRTFAISSPLFQTTAAGKSTDLKNNNHQEDASLVDQVNQEQQQQQGQVNASKRQPLVRNIKAIRQDVMDCFRHDGETIGLYANVMLQTYLTCCNSKIDADGDGDSDNNADAQQGDRDHRNKQACATTTYPASALRASATTHSHTTSTPQTPTTTTSSSTTMTLIPPDHVAFLGIGRGRSRGLETHVLPALARERKRRRFAHVQQIVLLHAQLSLAAAQAAPAAETAATWSRRQLNDDHDNLIKHPKELREYNPLVPPVPMSSCKVDDDNESSSPSPLCPCSLSSSPQSSLLLDTVATLLRAVSLQSSAPARLFAQIMGAADAADAWTEYASSFAPPSLLPDSDNKTPPQALAPSSSALARDNLVMVDRLSTLAHIPSPSPPPPPPVSSDEDSSDEDDEQAGPEHC